MMFWTRFGLQGTKVGNDAIDMEVNKGLLSLSAQTIGTVIAVKSAI
jgi:hypothetical protein